MKALWIIVATSSLLAGCEPKQADNETVLALPLIQEAIARQIPQFAGHWQPTIMDQVCRFASGENSRQSFQDWFTHRNVNVGELAEQDSGFRFIEHLDRAGARRSCTAWIITSVLSPARTWAGGVDDETAFKKKMASMTPLVKQVIETLASNAANASMTVYPSEQAYQQAINDAIFRQAENFINQTLNGRFVLAEYRQPGSDEMVYDYRLVQGQSQVLYNGVIWLGEGKIKGWRYTAKIKTHP